MTVNQVINQIKNESGEIFEVGVEKVRGYEVPAKTIKMTFYAGRIDLYEKLKKLLIREGYTVLS